MNPVSDQKLNSTSTGHAQSITQALKTVSRTGSDFAYLLRTCGIESGFNPEATARGSSATGLFQFTEQTWLQMVKSHGSQYGLGNYAAQIQTNADGSLSVHDAATRRAILDLRKDPQTSAAMACELNKSNTAILKKNVGGSVGPTELYLAHFLGAGGASSFLNALHSNPGAIAANIVPAAAAANSSLFYGASGQPNSVEQIYQHFAQKFDPTTESIGANTPLSSLALNSVQPATQASPTALPSSYASLLAEQMNLAQVASTISSDEEDENSISILA